MAAVFYDVTSPGNGRQQIFWSDKNRQRFGKVSMHECSEVVEKIGRAIRSVSS
jgi:hypothetical protein